RATITYDPQIAAPSDLIAAVDRTGYGATERLPKPEMAGEEMVSAFDELEAEPEADEAMLRRASELRHRRDKLLGGVALSAPVLLLSMFFMDRFPGENLLLLALTAPV